MPSCPYRPRSKKEYPVRKQLLRADVEIYDLISITWRKRCGLIKRLSTVTYQLELLSGNGLDPLWTHNEFHKKVGYHYLSAWTFKWKRTKSFMSGFITSLIFSNNTNHCLTNSINYSHRHARKIDRDLLGLCVEKYYAYDNFDGFMRFSRILNQADRKGNGTQLVLTFWEQNILCTVVGFHVFLVTNHFRIFFSIILLYLHARKNIESKWVS